MANIGKEEKKNEKTLKKIVPATYGKIESSQKKLSGDIDKKIEKRDHELEKKFDG